MALPSPLTVEIGSWIQAPHPTSPAVRPTNRVTNIVHSVIKPTQSAFMPGRYILEGVVVLHETIHELQRRKMDGVIFKIDFKKACNKVKWSFLQQTMRMKGFSPEWCELVAKFVRMVCWNKG
jgi:hypothetical protein